MTILVVAEHDNASLKAATLNTIGAAALIATFTDQAVHVLAAGHGARAAAEAAASVAGVEKVLLVDAPQLPHGLAEHVEAAVLNIAKNYSHILAPATAFGRSIAARIAAKLEVAQIGDITAVDSADTFERPNYAGNAIAIVQSADPIKVITVRATDFDPASTEGGGASVEKIDAAADAGISQLLSREVTKLDRPELTSANIVVSGGRGPGSGENHTKGFEQVVQTGKIVAPQLCIAVGISEPIQHHAGIKDSKGIVSIHKDEEAPIFSVANYGVVDNLVSVAPHLLTNRFEVER
ncbi:Electron transfer flavoprotein, alpha subunit (plasmid) [Paraburkholderia caribensis MBA4]|uniref:Electron transfer flavoprotein, alpha subunit n=1 Tax=Paraburkholderia caribensis MBA4 TaxID=1323664 RepID=A0A0P0RQ75_9BURK|nr:electron transfer flavoprotein subunit alpha/FixB family protein [Paraburkholderia caribensis]ALL71136.1 Electron transfer flavoprotein, alpha subunit [Paraburkholderia caribensis MBA4]